MSNKCFRVDPGRELRDERELMRMFLRKLLLSRAKHKGDDAEMSLAGLNSSIVRALRTRMMQVYVEDNQRAGQPT